MKISCNILKKHIEKSEDIDFLSIWDKFTIRTAEVEGVEVKGNQFDGVVTAKIIECNDHPESKKLHILKVDIGKEILQIVCGAPNVRVGLISACVKIGGHIGDIEISKRPLVGVDSYGMMCSGKELGISDDHSGIIELPDNTPIGEDFKKLFPVEDIIVEIDNKSLTHRPDLWGHYGIAREIAAITGHKLKPLDLVENQTEGEKLKIKINNPDLCYRYVGTKIDNITNNVTPVWMQIFLYYAGMRSIDLIVDLTNYLMLELGQPMHAFDSRVVKDIEVGLAEDGSTYTTLDGNERKLTNQDLMIKNDGKYFAVAGVMGGLDSEIVEDTNSIVLESACFEASTVRKTAIRLGLRTEASARYEKSLDPNMAIIATRRFIKLLKDENPNATLGTAMTDIYPTVQEENHITLDKSYLYKYMGFDIDDKTVMDILESLSFKVENKTNSFEVIAPTFRSTKDISIAADVIEEISRIYGYENFNKVPLKMAMTFGTPETTYDTEYEVKNYLATKYNLSEIHTYLWNKTSFLKKINVEVDNTKLLGKTEDNILRKDLSLSMLEAASINIKTYDEFGLFEIGTTVQGENQQRHLSILLTRNNDNLKEGYYLAKEIVYNLFSQLKNVNIKFLKDECDNYYNQELNLSIIANNNIIGHINVFNRQVSNAISKKKSFIVIDLDFEKYENVEPVTYQYQDISKYPSSYLDYTIITKRGTFYQNLDNTLNKFTSPIIINRELIDIYLEETTKKITIRYTVGSNEKTLTSDELLDFKTKFISFIKNEGLEIIEN